MNINNMKSGLWMAAKQFALSVPVAVAFNDLGAAHACPARPVRPICRSVRPLLCGRARLIWDGGQQ